MVEVFRSNVNFKGENGTGLLFSDLHPEHLQDQTIVWFDLHVSGKGFKFPDPYDREHWLPFEKGRNSDPKFIRLNPGKSITVQTMEIVGTDAHLTGTIVGSAGCSLRGLLITPGKVDPNFGPRPLALALTNGSDETVWIREGDKIGVISFDRLPTAHISGRIAGHAEAADDRLPHWLQRLIATSKDFYRRYKRIGMAAAIFYLFVIFTQAYVRAFAQKILETLGLV